MRPLITLTTDFGSGSPYVAQMKGVILSLCREVDLVDISHAVGPQNIREGAVVLADATPRFPPGTIHVAVVDPGVGTSRPILYAEIGQQRYVAPDNGLLSLLASRQRPQRIRALENDSFWLPGTSHTFHGRDIMAPVAAHLALGVNPDELGPLAAGLHLLPWPQPQRTGDEVSGEVLYVDSFGNVITNLSRDDVRAAGNPARLAIECAGRTIRGLVPTYAAAMPQELVALFDSQGRLELAVVQGNAARELEVEPGAAVTVAEANEWEKPGRSAGDEWNRP
ncbi:MAG TPA: SAM-dependent chlorinase/fluorinase [Pirellulaceae bacterium]|nr:SAM-dependent chlorinase/fluorinase [Pirellulaceae bacterium]